VPGFIIDASSVAAFLFQDEATPSSGALLNHVMATGVVVPSIWLYEVTNMLRQGERRGRLTAADRQEAIALLMEIAPEVEAPPLSQLLGAVLELAARHGLTAYDAAYLELAQRRGLPLATRDAALIRAAPLEGVAVLPA